MVLVFSSISVRVDACRPPVSSADIQRTTLTQRGQPKTVALSFLYYECEESVEDEKHALYLSAYFPENTSKNSQFHLPDHSATLHASFSYDTTETHQRRLARMQLLRL